MLVTETIRTDNDSPLPNHTESSGLTYCLVHGSWHGPECWELLRQPLEAAGHTVITPEVRIGESNMTYDDHARDIAKEIDSPADTVFVGHSRAGNILPRIVRYTKTARQLIYLCPGFDKSNASSLTHLIHPHPPDKHFPRFLAGVSVDNDGLTVFDKEIAKEVFYHDCRPEVAEAVSRMLRPMYRKENQPPVKRWPKVPAAMIYANHDRVIRSEYSRYISQYGKLAHTIGKQAIAIDTGHFPQLADPEGLFREIQRLPVGAEV